MRASTATLLLCAIALWVCAVVLAVLAFAGDPGQSVDSALTLGAAAALLTVVVVKRHGHRQGVG